MKRFAMPHHKAAAKRAITRLFASSLLIAILSVNFDQLVTAQTNISTPNAWQTTRTNPAFFPIAVWMQAPTNARAYRDAGINTLVGLWKGPTDRQLSDLHKAGMLVVCEQNQIALNHPARSNILAWIHRDEPDNATARGARFSFGNPVPVECVAADYRRMVANDSTRPVLLNLGQGVAWDNWYGRGTRNHRPDDYPRYLEACDIASFDIYPASHTSPEVAGNLWYVPQGVERLRRWTRNEKPVWNCIETTRGINPHIKPTPHEVRAEVWMSLIHGSRGIIYFAHQFKPAFVEAALLADLEMLAAITKLNQQITRLASALNSPTITNVVTIQSTNTAAPIAHVVKQLDGFTYIFAVAMRPLDTEARFELKQFTGSESVEVLDEPRTLPMSDGKFSDKFGPWGVHLYRVKSGSPR